MRFGKSEIIQEQDQFPQERISPLLRETRRAIKKTDGGEFALVFERKDSLRAAPAYSRPDAGYRGSFEPRSTRGAGTSAHSRRDSLSSLCSLSMDLTVRISSQTYALSLNWFQCGFFLSPTRRRRWVDWHVASHHVAFSRQSRLS